MCTTAMVRLYSKRSYKIDYNIIICIKKHIPILKIYNNFYRLDYRTVLLFYVKKRTVNRHFESLDYQDSKLCAVFFNIKIAII